MSATSFPTPPDVQAVLFDFGMVLSGPPNPQAWARLRQLTQLSEADLHHAYWLHRHDYDRGTFTGPGYFQQVASTSGLPSFTDQTVAGLIDADTDLWTDLNHDMVGWARSLQQRGIRTGILSNIGDSMQLGVEAKCSWLAAFDHRTWSHSLKLAKPERAIYQHAAAGLETSPAHILFVDDKPENIAGAVDAGMQAIQYSSHQPFVAEMQRRGLGYLL